MANKFIQKDQAGVGHTGPGRREAQHELQPVQPKSHVASASTSGVPKEYQKSRQPLKAPQDFDGDYDGDSMPGC